MIADRVFAIDPVGLLPALTPDSKPFWEALAGGDLMLQACAECGELRHPIAPVCPYCSGRNSSWRILSGCGMLFSWVRYHRSFLREFEADMPYVVATVQLQEGPRMFGLLRDYHDVPEIGAPVSLVIERWPGGRCVPAFDYQGRRPS